MFCPKCGRMNPDDGVLCKGCGAVLHEETEEKKEVKKSPLKKIMLILAILIVLTVIGVSIYNVCNAEELYYSLTVYYLV